MAIDHGDSGTVYAGTNAGGVFKTIDGGMTWAPASSGLTKRSIRAVAIDPNDSHVVYGGKPAGVFQSTTGGTQWRAMNAGFSNLDVLAVAIDPYDSNIVYCVTPRPHGRTTSTAVARQL